MTAKDIHFQRVEVKTYSGYRESEHPVGFWLDGQYQQVTNIIDRWYEGSRIAGGPIIRYFKVRTESGQEYLIRHNPPHNCWEIHIPVATNGESQHLSL